MSGTNLSGSVGGTRNAKDLLFRLNLPSIRRATGIRSCTERDLRSKAKLGEGKASFDARKIKVEGVRNHQRMLPYGFLIRIQFEVSELRDPRKGIGIIANNRVSPSIGVN